MMSKVLFYGVPIALLFSLVESSQNGPMVQTTYGWVKGGQTNTRGGKTIKEFLGIPYAQPPIGKFRYKSPKAMEPWSGVRDATQECDQCMQQFVLLEVIRNVVIGKEDCLCINIYTPSTDKKLPVIVWIHGGAYMGMSPEKAFYGPEFLLDKDVVLVTFGFRLGVLSFLTTGDEVIPGNFGMKDQAMALKWIKDNIAKFGGDDNSITLAGQSSGAGSIHLHMISPLSKDLFHRAILQSGSYFCPWGYSEPRVLIKQTKKVAELLDCPPDSNGLLTCLQTTSPDKIVGTTSSFIEFDNDPGAFWNPTVEPATIPGAFLTQNPWEANPVEIPILTGFNFAEGALKTYSITTGKSAEKFKRLNEEYDQIAPLSLMYRNTAPQPQYHISTAIREYFFKSTSAPITPAMTKEITEMYGDAWFTNGVLDNAERHPGTRYLYGFDYKQSVSVPQSLFGSTANYGASHGDELLYLFPMNKVSQQLQRLDRSNPDCQMSLKMVDLWTSFAATGKPSTPGVTWNPVKSKLDYLLISNEGLSMKKEPLKERRHFWKGLKLRELPCTSCQPQKTGWRNMLCCRNPDVMD